MNELANQVEALLFAVGRKLKVEELSRICRVDHKLILEALHSLRADYDSRASGLMLVQEGDGWKLSVREQYAAILQNIVAETELSRSVLETLAVIAWKAPMLQSEAVRIRSSKAYDHIAELETSGFISKERHGRSWMLKLTQRFFDYFALKTKEDIQEKFKDLHIEASGEGPQMLGKLQVVDEKPEQKKLEVYNAPAAKPKEEKAKVMIVNEDQPEEQPDEKRDPVA